MLSRSIIFFLQIYKVGCKKFVSYVTKRFFLNFDFSESKIQFKCFHKFWIQFFITFKIFFIFNEAPFHMFLSIFINDIVIILKHVSIILFLFFKNKLKLKIEKKIKKYSQLDEYRIKIFFFLQPLIFPDRFSSMRNLSL